MTTFEPASSVVEPQAFDPLAFDPVLQPIGYGLAAEVLLECGDGAPVVELVEPEVPTTELPEIVVMELPAAPSEPQTVVWHLPAAATAVEWFPEPASPGDDVEPADRPSYRRAG
ncbi:MAG TPA: hypothetical protein VM367_01800 [Pseudonocardia sp.]|nr:hypothetical protein [Pseudonocardia sp.]